MQKMPSQRKPAYLGRHFIVELYNCNNCIENLSVIKKILTEAAKISRATIIHTKLHKFSPQGITGYVLLAESHISIHTWPEYRYIAVDVFTCSHTMLPEAAVEYLINTFQAQDVKMKKIKRG